MAPAVDVLAQLAAAVTPAAPTARLLSNADGAVLDSPTQALGRLVTQVSNPVRWDRCLQTLADLGVTALIELPPAGTLVGLAKRALPGVELLAVKTPDDLDAARDLVARHSGATAAAASGAIA